MIIDPQKIYPVESDHPYAIGAQNISDDFREQIDQYNFHFAGKLCGFPLEEVRPILEFHYNQPTCDRQLFLYNLKYRVLEQHTYEPDVNNEYEKVFKDNPAEAVVLEWIIEKEEQFTKVETEEPAGKQPTQAQKILFIHYLQQVDMFFKTQDMLPMAEAIAFLTGQNLKNIYDKYREIDDLKLSAKNLKAVKDMFERLKLQEAVKLVVEDLKKAK